MEGNMFTQLKEGRQYSFSIELSTKDILDQNLPEILNTFDKTFSERKDVERLQQKDNIDIPIHIFREGNSGLRSIVKYLKEEKNLNFSEIAKLLGRDQRTIWSTYAAVKTKERKNKKIKNLNKKQTLKQKNDIDLLINSSIFKDRKLSILENTAHNLLQNYSVKDVAKLLGKNQMTIWTVKRRAEQKIRKKETINV